MHDQLTAFRAAKAAVEWVRSEFAADPDAAVWERVNARINPVIDAHLDTQLNPVPPDELERRRAASCGAYREQIATFSALKERAATLARLEAEYTAAAIALAEIVAADKPTVLARSADLSDREPLADVVTGRHIWFAESPGHAGPETLPADVLLRLPITADALPWVVGDRVEWVAYPTSEAAMSALEHAVRSAHQLAAAPPPAE